MEQIVEKRSQYTLYHGENGYAWTMTTEHEQRWYYHPETRGWTLHPYASCTAEGATVGFDLDSTVNAVQFHAPVHTTATCRESSEGGIVIEGTTGNTAPTDNGHATEGR